MQHLKELFLKDYTRPIETVIKADDLDHIHQEVDEFVLTTEVGRKLADFYDAYTSYDGVNGAWISGFFGSGKSHLLKILSFVLENKTINHHSLVELFAAKVTDDSKLRGDIISCAARFPSESILFNIDQQAQTTNKSDGDVLLQVFYKVFYDHQGFYGFQPHVAQFEQYLAKEGKWEAFKKEFRAISGKDWLDARNDYVDPLNEEALAEACGNIYDQDPAKYEGYLEGWEDKLKLSIEDFALQVKAYIDTKPKGFRLNFFVDEVGQFIAEHAKLMLNLQTIAESLNTKCKGNSWVVVTSQEDLESLVGDDRVIQRDDFSKIQGRFRVRLPLTSANVDEVLEKRLLQKKEEGKQVLRSIFEQEKENMKTLFSFNGGRDIPTYRSADEFCNKYPFTPQHFELFQQTMRMLSRHNAFQGKHASVGERSMLGVFQEVLKSLNVNSPRQLVSYDLVFEGLRSTLRGEVQNSIIQAQRQFVNNPMAVRVLKLLFLVKYIDNFKASLHNISVLMLDSLDVNPLSHQKEVEAALNLLEQQTYIQRKGEIYEFLTNEEKDVENEIKEIRVDEQELSLKMGEYIFNGILKDDKITYRGNKQAFEFTRKVDGMLVGRQKELTIEVITPNNPQYSNPSYFSSTSMGDNTLLLIRLAEDKRSLYELRMELQTDKYLRLNHGTAETESRGDVFREKGKQNSERKRILHNAIGNLLVKSTYFLNGSEYKGSTSSDGRTKIIEAFQDLVKVAYSKLPLLGSANFDEQQLHLILTKGQTKLFGSGDDALSNPEQEMLNFILRRKNKHERTNLLDIRDHFARKPYGWSVMATWAVAALLFRHTKIEATKDTELLDNKKFLEVLNNNRAWSLTLIEPQLQFDRELVNHLRQVYQSAFNENNPHTEARDIALHFKKKAAEEHKDVNQILASVASYPFLSRLEPLAKLLQNLSLMGYDQLINSVREWDEELMDARRNVQDPILQFWNGEQRKIYDEILRFHTRNRSNFDYVEAGAKTKVSALQEAEEPYRGSLVREAKQAMDELDQVIRNKIEEERRLLKEATTQKISLIRKKPLFSGLDAEKQQEVLQPLTALLGYADAQDYIANLHLKRQELDNLFVSQLNLMTTLLPEKETAQTPRVRYVHLRDVEKEVSRGKSQLETEEDVDAFLQHLRQILVAKIQSHHKINLS